MNKKGYQIKDLLPIALVLGVAIIAIGIMADVVTNVQDTGVTNTAGCNSTTTTSCGYVYNISGDGLLGLGELASWTPTIALVVAAAIIIGVLVYSFAFR